MPTIYNIRLFYNTGYDTGNIPDSPALLDTCEYKDFDAVLLRQSRGLASVKLRADYKSVRDADYCRMTSNDEVSYYVITDIVMLTDSTAELALTLDPLTTAGGISNISIIGGQSKRAHVSDDTLFNNILPEPWAPSNRLIIRQKKTIHGVDENAGKLNIAIATCNLDQADNYEALVAEAIDSRVTCPKLPTMGLRQGTVMYFPHDDPELKGYAYQMPGMYAFNLSAAGVKDGINATRSLGIETSIMNMYTVPSLDIKTATLEGGDVAPDHYTEIIGNKIVYASGMPYKYHAVKNNKAVCLYNNFMLASVASGNSMSYAAQDLYAGGEAPDFATKADPSPNGTVYCQPTWYEGKQTTKQEQSVAGAPWNNAGYVYQGSSGGGMAMMNARRANIQLEIDRDYNQSAYRAQQAKQVIGAVSSLVTGDMGVVDAGSDTGKAFAAGFNMVTNLANSAIDIMQTEKARKYDYGNKTRQMGDNIFDASAQANISAPEIAFPISVNASSYFGNAFLITQITLTDEDLARFDNFLSAYGYAVDKPFETSDLNNRTKHNYVLVSDCQIKSANASRSVCEQINEMFKAGVRVWHVKPDKTALYDNPKKG